ncbi:MAG: transcription antitermination factor NusB [Kiritimatiellae bacterium]|nr:transcription antitermination factor NusB [Kiritimatiellia bacterium]
MTTRRDAREWALQILFEVDLNPPKDLEVVLSEFWSSRKASKKQSEFATRLVHGVVNHRDDLDVSLHTYAENWDVKRMGVVERNVMRIALFELLHCEDIPPVVTINEAVDIAKYFSTHESGRFVNGILDRVRKTLDRPSRQGKNGD